MTCESYSKQWLFPCTTFTNWSSGPLLSVMYVLKIRSPKKDWISAMLACDVWDVALSCWKYPVESSSSSNWFTKLLKISIYAAVVIGASRKMGPIMCRRDIPHQTPIISEWRGSSCTDPTDTFLFISHSTKVLLFKFRCNIFIGVGIIKEMPVSVARGTQCINGKKLIIGLYEVIIFRSLIYMMDSPCWCYGYACLVFTVLLWSCVLWCDVFAREYKGFELLVLCSSINKCCCCSVYIQRFPAIHEFSFLVRLQYL